MSDWKFKIRVEMAVKRMLAVALHIRDCERCHRIYGAAFEVSIEANPEIPHGVWAYAPNSYKVLEACIRDLRDCERWPTDVSNYDTTLSLAICS